MSTITLRIAVLAVAAGVMTSPVDARVRADIPAEPERSAAAVADRGVEVADHRRDRDRRSWERRLRDWERRERDRDRRRDRDRVMEDATTCGGKNDYIGSCRDKPRGRNNH